MEAGTMSQTEEELAAEQAALDAEDAAAPAARRSLADLAADEPDPEPEGPEQYMLFGTAPRLNGSVKGGKVNQSAVKFKAAAQPLPGQFDIDEMVELRVMARVDNLSFPTKRDGDGKLMQVTRTHHMTFVSIEQLGDVAAEFAEIDGRDAGAELTKLRARIAELEGLLET